MAWRVTGWVSQLGNLPGFVGIADTYAEARALARKLRDDGFARVEFWPIPEINEAHDGLFA